MKILGNNTLKLIVFMNLFSSILVNCTTYEGESIGLTLSNNVLFYKKSSRFTGTRTKRSTRVDTKVSCHKCF